MKSKWLRVTPKHPCPICGKPDWCSYTADGEVVRCMRVPNNHPCRGDSGGWVYRQGGTVCKVAPSDIYEEPDNHMKPRSVEAVLAEWKKNTITPVLTAFARDLGVSRESLERLGCAWCADKACWAFPMRNEQGVPIGIRLRSKTRKTSVSGSRSGLFFDTATADKARPGAIAWLTEGPTDTAALLTLDEKAIVFGRSSLTSCWQMLKRALERRGIGFVNICSDDETQSPGRLDCPGFTGNIRMAKALGLPCKFVSVPGFKDIREYAKAGGSLKELGMILGHQSYKVPT